MKLPVTTMTGRPEDLIPFFFSSGFQRSKRHIAKAKRTMCWKPEQIVQRDQVEGCADDQFTLATCLRTKLYFSLFIFRPLFILCGCELMVLAIFCCWPVSSASRAACQERESQRPRKPFNISKEPSNYAPFHFFRPRRGIDG